MKYFFWLTFSAVLFSANCLGAELQFPMRNDPNFATKIEKPSYEAERGPLIVVDKGHNNFFITTGLIKPLLDLLESGCCCAGPSGHFFGHYANVFRL